MAHALRISTLALSFTVLLPGLAFPQASPDASSLPTPTQTRVADVYIGTSNGVYLYHAGSNGSLSLVSGSPFAVAGAAIGSNRHYFFSLQPNFLHSYPVASNGAIQSQASHINTQLYSGSDCGTAQLAVLDHTGHDLYVQLYGGSPTEPEPCVTLQSFKVSTTGAFSFLGSTVFATQTDDGLGGYATPVKLSGNGSYAYSASTDHECYVRTWILERESSGAIMYNDRWEDLSVPSTPPDWRWYPFVETSDPTSHMAVAMWGESGNAGPCGEERYPTQLASFTIASDGSLSSTNTPGQMPTPQVNPQVLNMSALGDFLAVGGSGTNNTGNGTQTAGLQVFHFNGANPVTPFGKVLTTAPIDQIHWDRNNHLYALSDSTRKLYVYSVTSSSITATPGSPFTMPSTPNSLSVVTLACSAPATDGVHICAPAGSSTVASPVLVEASANVSGTIDRMELWVDGVKKYTTHSAQLITTISRAAGKHQFAVSAFNTDGKKWANAVYATVK